MRLLTIRPSLPAVSELSLCSKKGQETRCIPRSGKRKEKSMRQIGFVLLITLAIVSFTGGLSRAVLPGAPDSTDLSILSVDSLNLTQKTATAKPASSRMDKYQCVEYCSVVRQSCDGKARIQPDEKIATIGSRENNQWSGACQSIYNACMRRCDTNESSISWRRSKIAKRLTGLLK
jgi:hypothetical protein